MIAIRGVRVGVLDSSQKHAAVIRKMWPDPIESLEFMRTVNGETLKADDESKLIDVAPTYDEDLSIEV